MQDMYCKVLDRWSQAATTHKVIHHHKAKKSIATKYNPSPHRYPSPQMVIPNCTGSLTRMTSGTTLPGKAPWHNNNPFVILPLTARVKKCVGCPYPFRDPLGPPFIQHKEKDYNPDQFGNLKVSNETKHYYHCQMPCIIARHPYFLSAVFATGTRDGDNQYSGQ